MKNFFAKLANWGSNREMGWEKAKTAENIERSRREAARESELARERQQQNLRNIPEGERLKRLSEEVEGTVEKRDQAA